MDQGALVTTGQLLVKAMDRSQLAPRLAMWVRNADADTWKLWLVPPKGLDDKLDFYRKLSVVIASNRHDLPLFDVGETLMVPDSHPAMQGMKTLLHAEGLASIPFPGNRFGDYYLPEGIILRSAL